MIVVEVVDEIFFVDIEVVDEIFFVDVEVVDEIFLVDVEVVDEIFFVEVEVVDEIFLVDVEVIDDFVAVFDDDDDELDVLSAVEVGVDVIFFDSYTEFDDTPAVNEAEIVVIAISVFEVSVVVALLMAPKSIDDATAVDSER